MLARKESCASTDADHGAIERRDRPAPDRRDEVDRVRILLPTMSDAGQIGGTSTHIEMLSRGLEEIGHTAQALYLGARLPEAARLGGIVAPAGALNRVRKGWGMIYSAEVRGRLLGAVTDRELARGRTGDEPPGAETQTGPVGPWEVLNAQEVYSVPSLRGGRRPARCAAGAHAARLPALRVAQRGLHHAVGVGARLPDGRRDAGAAAGRRDRDRRHPALPARAEAGTREGRGRLGADELHRHLVLLPHLRRPGRAAGQVGHPARPGGAVLPAAPGQEERRRLPGAGACLHGTRRPAPLPAAARGGRRRTSRYRAGHPGSRACRPRCGCWAGQDRDAILELFRLADIVLVPSVHSENVEEATSLSALEAMASGRPADRRRRGRSRRDGRRRPHRVAGTRRRRTRARGGHPAAGRRPGPGRGPGGPRPRLRGPEPLAHPGRRRVRRGLPFVHRGPGVDRSRARRRHRARRTPARSTSASPGPGRSPVSADPVRVPPPGVGPGLPAAPGRSRAGGGAVAGRGEGRRRGADPHRRFVQPRADRAGAGRSRRRRGRPRGRPALPRRCGSGLGGRPAGRARAGARAGHRTRRVAPGGRGGGRSVGLLAGRRRGRGRRSGGTVARALPRAWSSPGRTTGTSPPARTHAWPRPCGPRARPSSSPRWALRGRRSSSTAGAGNWAPPSPWASGELRRLGGPRRARPGVDTRTPRGVALPAGNRSQAGAAAAGAAPLRAPRDGVLPRRLRSGSCPRGGRRRSRPRRIRRSTPRAPTWETRRLVRLTAAAQGVPACAT